MDTTLCDGRKLEITPGLFGDFRKMIYADNYFDLVVLIRPTWLELVNDVAGAEIWGVGWKLES